MKDQVFPSERRAADDALRGVRDMAPTVSILYAEIVRFQDGDRSAARRAGGLLEALRQQVDELGEVTRRAGFP